MPIANNIIVFNNPRHFRQAEYLDNETVIVETCDNKRIKIYHIKLMDWHTAFVRNTENDIDELMRNHTWRFEK